MAYKKAPRVKRNKKGEYFMRPQDMINSATKLEVIIYRIGEHGLFQVVGEYKNYYVGHWQRGLYNQSVLKEDLRKLTDEEFTEWNNRYEVICGVKVLFNIIKD